MVSTDQSDTSSDSEYSSDEEVNKSVKIALQSMKKSLAITDNSGQQTESRTADFIQTTHRKIYDTFDSDDDSDDFQNETVVSSKSSLTGNKLINGEDILNSFVIDKTGAEGDGQKLQTEVFTIDLSGFEDSESQNVDAEKNEKLNEETKKKNNSNPALSSSLHSGIKDSDIYVNVDPLNISNEKEKKSDKIKRPEIVEPEIMKKSVLTEDYEQQSTIPTEKSRRAEKKLRKIEREKTKGSKWFDMPAPELTDDRKNDFLVYQMRKSLDPKRFYKTNDAVGIPKYYQFGTVVEHSADFYDSRIPKKERKANMVEELLADAKFRQYNKRKFTEIQEAKRLGSGPYNMMKKIKKKKAK